MRGCDLVVVGLDGVRDGLGLAVLAQQLGADDGVAALDLVGERLADVVQERAALDQRRLDAEFGGHDAGDVRGLDEVAEHVLAVAGAVLQPARASAAGARRDRGCRRRPGRRAAARRHSSSTSALLLLVDLLDAVRVDATVERRASRG